MSVSLKHECPWCERIFSVEEGKWTYIHGQEVLICSSCVSVLLAQSGAWISFNLSEEDIERFNNGR